MKKSEFIPEGGRCGGSVTVAQDSVAVLGGFESPRHPLIVYARCTEMLKSTKRWKAEAGVVAGAYENKKPKTA